MVVSSGQRQMLICQRLLQLCWQSLLRDPAEQPAAVSRMSTDHPSLTGAGPDVDAMKAVGKAHQHRSLHEFQATLKSYHHELQVSYTRSSLIGFLHGLSGSMLHENKHTHPAGWDLGLSIGLLQGTKQLLLVHCADKRHARPRPLLLWTTSWSHVLSPSVPMCRKLIPKA